MHCLIPCDNPDSLLKRKRTCTETTKSIGDSIEMKMFQLLNDFKQTFPNVLIAMRIYLSLMSSNCTGERSFSKLKRIKNDLRSTMGQERLTHLSLMSIEHGVLTNLDFDDLVTDFARRKCRKRPL